MPKVKEQLDWLAINPDTLPAPLKVKHEAIRELFAQIKTAKASFEADAVAMLKTVAKALPADAKAKLKVTDKGAFPAGTELKFSYLRGIAVATATAAKTKTQAGTISLG